MAYGNPHGGKEYKGNPHTNSEDRRGDVEEAMGDEPMEYEEEAMEYNSKNSKMMCPHCGKKYSASNVGGASVGGGT